MDALIEKHREPTRPVIRLLDLRRERWRSARGFPLGNAGVVMDQDSLLEEVTLTIKRVSQIAASDSGKLPFVRNLHPFK